MRFGFSVERRLHKLFCQTNILFCAVRRELRRRTGRPCSFTAARPSWPFRLPSDGPCLWGGWDTGFGSGTGLYTCRSTQKQSQNPWDYDKQLYKQRNQVERLFRRIKRFRRIFTRYDKLDIIFLAFVYFALIVDALMWTLPSINSGKSQARNITAISGCAVVPPPLPRLVFSPIAWVVLIHNEGVSVVLVECTAWISSSQASSWNLGLWIFSHIRRYWIVVLLRIQLWMR